MAPRKPSRDAAIAEASAEKQTAHTNRMAALYLLSGRAPDVDITTHGARVRAWGLHRHDGGVVIVQESDDPTSADLANADRWCERWRGHVAGYPLGEDGLRWIAFRDEVCPAIRAAMRDLAERKGLSGF